MPLETDEFVRSLARGLAVIETFNQQRRSLSLSEVARDTGVNRATARRLLHTLVRLGYANFDGKLFSLSPRCLQLGYAYLSSLDVWQVAQPFMVAFVENVHESCSAAVLDGADIVYVARVPTTSRIMSINLNVGTRLPAHVTSMGRVLLAGLSADERRGLMRGLVPLQAYTPQTLTNAEQLLAELDRVASQGYALVDQELEPGLRSLAVPILDASGGVLAALNVGGHASRASGEEMLTHYLPPLREAAQAISQAMVARRD